MNLQQLKYIIAVDDYRHFGKAAEGCHVTQPTLSMMIRKLEKELGVTLFDRNRQPVIPTPIGEKVIRQARVAIRETDDIANLINQQEGKITGTLRVGIIPTLAPYLLPLFIRPFLQNYPEVELIVSEMVTGQIEEGLQGDALDAGILVTPLRNRSLEEIPLFHEKFYAYLSASHPLFDKQYILAEDIDVNQLWLLEEGHCFRSQIVNLCELKRSRVQQSSFKYAAGSIETLKNFVDRNSGITILPELATLDMSDEKRNRLRSFREPEPVREVSLVIHRSFAKKRMVEAVKESILESLSGQIEISSDRGRVIDI